MIKINLKGYSINDLKNLNGTIEYIIKHKYDGDVNIEIDDENKDIDVQF